MTRERHKSGGVEAGRKLYRRMFGNDTDTSTAVDEFAALDDTPMNRGRLAHIGRTGGTRGRAARAKLDEWYTAASESKPHDPLNDVQPGTRQHGVDPFGPPAA